MTTIPDAEAGRQVLLARLEALREGYDNAVTRARAAETLARATPDLVAAAKRVLAFAPIAKWLPHGPFLALRQAVERAEGKASGGSAVVEKGDA
jgi:hypothetical protein